MVKGAIKEELLDLGLAVGVDELVGMLAVFSTCVGLLAVAPALLATECHDHCADVGK